MKESTQVKCVFFHQNLSSVLACVFTQNTHASKHF